MKIKNQLIITISAFIIILSVISVSIFYTEQQATILADDLFIVGNVEKGISNLNNIADSYFLYQQDSQLTDWQSNITALYSYTSQLNSTDSNRNQISNTLRYDIQRVDLAFNATVNYLEETPLNTTIRDNPEFQTTWSQLSDSLQTVSIDSTQLSQTLHYQVNTINVSNIFLIVALLVAFALYLVVSYYIMFRHTLRAISELDKGFRIIGTGNFDHEVKTGTNDELGELSDSVNKMRIQLKTITTQLKEQERLAGIGETAGMVGHDLRNPLQAIVGDVYLIEEELKTLHDSQSKEDIQESIQSIADQINYMDKIVSDLQTFVKPVESKKELVNAKQLILNAMHVIELPASIKLTLAVEANLAVNTDPQLLKRVLVNLINNAIQAMPEGGTLTIIGKKTVENNVQLIVKDTGIGIPDEIKPKIFTPLFTTKSRGQGFGLAVCKRVIEAQGGTITFDSQVGKGTKFVVELPKKG